MKTWAMKYRQENVLVRSEMGNYLNLTMEGQMFITEWPLDNIDAVLKSGYLSQKISD